MAISTRRRIGVGAIVAALAVAGFGVSNVRADPTPDLPSIAADQLLSSTLSALAHPFTISGDVSTHLDLGIPQLPSSFGGPVGPVAFVIGDQRFRVWRSPDGLRVAHLLDLGEQDVVANATDAWYWDSSTMTAVHLALAPGATNAPAVPGSLDFLSIARRAIGAVAPYADLSVEGTAVVAGRPCYELVLTPTSGISLVGRIAVAIDAQTRLPLRLQVFARGSDTSAIQGGFTSVSYDPIDPAMFTFAPPPGTTVRQASDLLPPVHQHLMARGTPDPTSGPNDHRIFGKGFDTRVAVRLDAPPPSDVSAFLPYAGPLLSAIVVDRGGQTWLLVGPVPVDTLQQDAATLP
ncbi:MAG: LolA family protein [Actinomycetota bacterium]